MDAPYPLFSSRVIQVQSTLRGVGAYPIPILTDCCLFCRCRLCLVAGGVM